MRATEWAVALRLALAEAFHERVLALGFLLVLILVVIPVAAKHDAARLIDAMRISVLLAFLAGGAVIDGEYRSRRAEVLLAAGADESVLAVAGAVARAAWFLAATWVVAATGLGVVLLAGARPDLPRLVSLLALVPLDVLTLFGLTVLLSNWFPRWTNVLGTVIVFFLVLFGGEVVALAGWSENPLKWLARWLAGARFWSAAPPGELPIVYADWWRQALSVAGKTLLLVVLAAIAVRRRAGLWPFRALRARREPA